MTKKSGIRFIYVGELLRTPHAPDHMGIIQGLSQLKQDGIISEYKIVDPVLHPNTVVMECNEFKSDIIVHGNTDSLDKNWPHDIKTNIQCFFMGDIQPRQSDYDRWNLWVANGVNAFQAVFISNRDQLNMWSEAFKAPAYFWPHGCYVPDKLEKGTDLHNLLFIGSMTPWGNYQSRVNLIQEIGRLTKIDYITADDVAGRNKIWSAMPKLYHTANFVLDISHFWNIDGYASGRYWYSGGLGGCSLTKRFPGCEEFYTDKTEKLYFDTPEETVELMDQFKNSIDTIKWNAYTKNKNCHNYRIRFLEMFRLLGL